MKIKRSWAMPSKHTFQIKPIRDLIECYIKGVVVDPFANNSKYGTITNDLNPDFNTDYNLDALVFLRKCNDNIADVVLYDPPFSFRQATECYKKYGREELRPNITNMKYWADCKDEIARIVKPGGLVICCGWNSNGIGKNRNFKLLEVLLVAHGGRRNDTIVTVERKCLSEPSISHWAKSLCQ